MKESYREVLRILYKRLGGQNSSSRFGKMRKAQIRKSVQTLFAILKKPHDLAFRFELLRETAKWLVPGYRLKWPQMEWWDHALFNEYLTRFDELEGMNTDRRWMLCQLLRLIEGVPGDTAECGVFTGSSSFLICIANERSLRHARWHHGFDSFEGLSEPTEFDSRHWSRGDLSCDVDAVRRNLKEFKNVSFHRGWIPSRFVDVAEKRFSFVHIDVDLYEPTRDSIAFFYPRVNAGGIIVCDDYGFTTCPGVTRAVDGFLRDKPEKMISLPDGGGFLIRGCQTSGLSFAPRHIESQDPVTGPRKRPDSSKRGATKASGQ